MPGLYWGGDFELVKIFIETGQADPADFRFFLGYSGWAAEQLKTELDENSWIVAPGSVKHAFDLEHKEVWKEVLRGMGKKYERISNYPTDPSLN